MKKNKKGIMYEFFLFIALIFLVTSAFIVLNKKYDKLPDEIGERQFMIFKAYQQAENSLFYLDQSAKYAAQQSIYDLGQKGYLLNPDCEEYLGYKIWNFDKDNGKICYPNKEQNIIFLIEIFNKNLNKYLSTNPYINDIYSKDFDIDVKVEDNRFSLVAISNKKLTFKITSKIDEEVKEDKIIQDKDTITFSNLCKDNKCSLTKEAYKKLEQAQKEAEKQGYNIVVTSGYRSLEEQRKIWFSDKYSIYNTQERRKYVCDPTQRNPEQNCPHLTGNAVDVRFKGKTQATMAPDEWKKLEEIMTSVGWIRYSREEWHFECCGTDRFNRAVKKGVTVIV